jgi:hypothetical protein
MDLLFLRGTLPEYVLPKLDDALAAELLDAFKPRPQDPPFEVVPRDSLEAFLSSHVGEGLFYREQLVDDSKP